MGVFNGNSIYNYGAVGGGGLVYYGLIPDSDFMQVENNGFYKYHNEFRNDINLYLDVSEDDVLFDIISIENDIASNINIFILKNGFYYPIPYIGSNSLSAGKNYKIVLLGDSYTVDEVDNNINPLIPLYAKIGNITTRIYFSLDNQVIFTSNIKYYNNVEAINISSTTGWNVLSDDVRNKFESANIPLENSGYFDGSNWQNVGIRAIIFNGPYCKSARGYENYSSTPEGGDYGTNSPAYRCSLVLWKNA